MLGTRVSGGATRAVFHLTLVSVWVGFIFHLLMSVTRRYSFVGHSFLHALIRSITTVILQESYKGLVKVSVNLFESRNKVSLLIIKHR